MVTDFGYLRILDPLWPPIVLKMLLTCITSLLSSLLPLFLPLVFFPLPPSVKVVNHEKEKLFLKNMKHWT